MEKTNYESGICVHCGKKEDNHLTESEMKELDILDQKLMPHPVDVRRADELMRREWSHLFTDSGLSRIHENAVEVLRAAQEVVNAYNTAPEDWLPTKELNETMEALEAAINKSLSSDSEGKMENKEKGTQDYGQFDGDKGMIGDGQ